MSDEPTLIRLPLYEPASCGDVRLTESDCLQHLLILGATGSGKSCLLHRIIDQIISHRAGDKEHKPGLLILDAKSDMMTQVRDMAAATGRESDVVVLGPDGDHYHDLFASMRSLSDVDLMTRRMLSASGSMGGRENVYWDETRYALIDAAVTLAFMAPERVTFAGAIALMREWFFGAGCQSARVQQAVEKMVQGVDGQDVVEGQKVMQTLDTVALWQGLDPRTRSNVQSTLMCALRPFLSVPAGRCFTSQGRPAFEVGRVAADGRICVVSVNASTEPGLASLLFKLLQGDFFRAVHQRGAGAHRLCGLVADELPLVACVEDVEALATVRSRRCFVAAASQGLAGLDEKLGVRARKALLSNFGSIIFLRGREEEVDLFAAVHLGTVEQTIIKTVVLPTEEGNLLASRTSPIKIRQIALTCPPGTLGRLSPHQGFAALPGHRQQELPLWFVPWFESTPNLSADTLIDPASVEHLLQLMRGSGFKELTKLGALEAALQVLPPETGRNLILEETTSFFRSRGCMVPQGLETLPASWLKALPGTLWSLRKPHWTHLPFMICELAVADGLLLVRFAQETLRRPVGDVNSYNQVRISLNAALFPSRYRPLKRRHGQQVRLRNPDLGTPSQLGM